MGRVWLGRVRRFLEHLTDRVWPLQPGPIWPARVDPSRQQPCFLQETNTFYHLVNSELADQTIPSLGMGPFLKHHTPRTPFAEKPFCTGVHDCRRLYEPILRFRPRMHVTMEDDVLWGISLEELNT